MDTVTLKSKQHVGSLDEEFANVNSQKVLWIESETHNDKSEKRKQLIVRDYYDSKGQNLEEKMAKEARNMCLLLLRISLKIA